MAHVRQQIREAIAAAVTGLTTTGANVFQTRVYPLQNSNLPALTIATDSEAVGENQTLTFNSRTVERTLEVTITAHVKATDDFDDSIDTIFAEVEAALGRNLLTGLIREIRLSDLQTAFSDDSEKPTGQGIMTWMVDYQTATNDAENVV